jgi:lipopolysaccharide biosynthesis regulator YciM
MACTRAASLVGLVVLLGSLPAWADEGNIRRDPEGKTGISPYMETIAKAEKEFVAKNLDQAQALLEKASQEDAEKMLAFYRLGEVHLAKGDLDKAEAAWNTAKSKQGTPTLQAKAMFCLADLSERRHDWAKAKEAWNAYSSFLQSNPRAAGYPSTAADRLRQIERRVNDEKAYGEVKARIAAREKESDAEAKKNAKP